MEIERSFDYDLFVIGGGSGGLSCAKKAAKLGAKVALADFVQPSPLGTKWGLGGTCVNVGCIPKKLMHHASLLGEMKKDQVSAGWKIDPNAAHDWGHMLAIVNTHIKRLNWGYKKQLLEAKVKYFNCYATFKDKHTLSLKNKKGKIKTVTAERILVAVGGRPRYLDLDNIYDLAITSDDVFWRKKIPGKTLIIGGGYIGLECAGFLKGMGYEVDVLVRSVLLRGFDRDMVKRIHEDMQHMGVNFERGSITNIQKDGERIRVLKNIKKNPDLIKGGCLEGMEIEESQICAKYDTVILAIGRIPCTDKMGLKEIGVELNKSGHVPVNSQYQTNIDNVYAIGDIMEGSPELTPVAIKEGILVAKYMFKPSQKHRPINYNAIATTVFSPLEYSKVGLSEEEAVAKYGEEGVEVYHSSFKPLEWNFYEGHKDNMCYSKVIVTRDEEEVVLGIHYIGPNAGEVMQGFALALLRKTTFEDLKEIGKIIQGKIFWVHLK